MLLRLLIPSVSAVVLFSQTAPPQSNAPAAPAAPSEEAKPASVSGKVTSLAGQPLKKVALTLRNVGPTASGQAMPNPYGTASDAEGNFIFESVEPGRYSLSANRPGFQRMNFGARHGVGMGTVLTLTSGQTMSSLNMALSPEIVISGKVIDAEGDPAMRAQIRVLRSSFFSGSRRLVPSGYAQTDDNGEYKFQSLSPGKYYVQAYPPRDDYGSTPRSAALPPAPGQPAKLEEALVSTYFPSVTEISAATVIELKQGHDRPGTNIMLRKSAVFHVRGHVAAQAPVVSPQYRVAIMPRSSVFFDFTGSNSSTVGKDGGFEIAAVAPGSYNLMLVNQSGMLKALATMPIDIATRNIDEVKLAVESPVDIPGQIDMEKPTGAGNDPAKSSPAPFHAQIGLQALDGPNMGSPNASALEDGSFTLSGVSTGRFRVYAYSTPDGSYVKSIRFADQDVLNNGLTVQPGAGGTTRLDVVLGANAAKLEGSVQDADGKPVSAATVTLVPGSPNPNRQDLYRQTTTDQNGKFTMKQIAPGKYHVYAWEELEQGNQYDPDFMKTFETKGTPLEIAESGTLQVTLTWIKQ